MNIRKIFFDDKKIFVLFFIVIFLLKFNTLSTPYFEDESKWYIPSILLISQNNLKPIISGEGLPKEIEEVKIDNNYLYGWKNIQDFGKPPFFHETIALAFLTFGHKIFIGRLVVILFSYLSLIFIYLLGKFLFGKKEGLIATLLLLFNPMFFSSSGRTLPVIATLSLSIMTIYFFFKNNKKLFLLFSIFLVLSKETGVIVLLSLIIYKFVYKNKKRYSINYSLLFIPIIIFLLWFIYRKDFILLNTKYIVYPILSSFILSILSSVFSVFSFFFIEQGRIILTILLVYYLFRKNFREEYFLFFTIITFFVIYRIIYSGHLRHIIIVFPLLALMYAHSITKLIKNVKIQYFLLIIVTILSISSFYSETSLDWEENLRYLNFVKLNQKTVNFLQGEDINGTIWSDEITYLEFLYPYVGYVKTPLNMSPLTPILSQDEKTFNSNFKKGDIIIENKGIMNELFTYYKKIDFVDNKVLIKTFERHNDWVKIYLVT